ncbi:MULTISPECIES: glycerophosphodiester phosphodiesterase [unclassified Robiginitalea]|uniref:glycerophosphodiester phosphodiesterase n=1 Tax=Robiginitalea TaxID=252306 RepID=UPI00234A6023|nr:MULTISPECIES: glycerophosphodiester phosphodiesterase family protein [unclassified Robiginitalea]MDC6352844.1 glycerophosphodiester phosphodiesterase family protein [Robiginitalea sp. PM2]MDC6373990.1 glycerophosphodiester phosphodiesterase family protein [Robiginitalea sp. SP8]
MRYFWALILTLMMNACISTGNKPLVIGHRGAMGYETENSIASVQKALDLGVDMIEIDVFRIKSGEIAVFHDETVDELTNGGGRIEEYNAFDLRQLILEGRHRIPLLQDVLKTIKAQVPLNIELKGAGTSDRVNFITDYYIREMGWTADQFLISSFNWDELREFRRIDPEARIAVLTDGDPLEALEVARELGAEAINPHAGSLTPENTAAIKETGFRVYAWTVNDRARFDALAEMGVDGVFTDYPDRMQ